MLGKSRISITSPTTKPNTAKIVKIQNESSLLKPDNRISKSAKSVVAKGMRKSLNNIDQVAINAMDILKNKMTTKVLEPN
ncbi:hypothetical protein ANSO36C_57160 [Nostoc cf. commune SO-36]|uniref:Uncharacterized protein n=1 Tax=Nostoc cf. commune SO-36 TaxID=449208 RepID=A0ABN6QAQ3_NOSCO|nr:hypothetical protein ANSO36C_57160 [Nostoc cf. commune SO-36]